MRDKQRKNGKKENEIPHHQNKKRLPRDESFLVLIILAANSRHVDFCTHRRTTENAPL